MLFHCSLVCLYSLIESLFHSGRHSYWCNPKEIPLFALCKLSPTWCTTFTFPQRTTSIIPYIHILPPLSAPSLLPLPIHCTTFTLHTVQHHHIALCMAYLHPLYNHHLPASMWLTTSPIRPSFLAHCMALGSPYGQPVPLYNIGFKHIPSSCTLYGSRSWPIYHIGICSYIYLGGNTNVVSVCFNPASLWTMNESL